MKPWSNRSYQLIKNAILESGREFDVRINGIPVLKGAEELEDLELALLDYDPKTEEISFRIYSGKSNRSTDYSFGPSQEETGTAGDGNVFDLKLKVQGLEQTLKFERIRNQDMMEALKKQLGDCEKALEVRNQTITALQAKDKGLLNQLGAVKDLVGVLGNGSNSAPAVPQQVGAAATPDPLSEWKESLEGLDGLSAEDKETVKDALFQIALNPEFISRLKSILDNPELISTINELAP